MKYTHAGFQADAPDGHYAFVAAADNFRMEGAIHCDTGAFETALGLDCLDDPAMEITKHIVDNADPNVIGAIIEAVNAMNGRDTNMESIEDGVNRINELSKEIKPFDFGDVMKALNPKI